MRTLSRLWRSRRMAIGWQRLPPMIAPVFGIGELAIWSGE